MVCDPFVRYCDNFHGGHSGCNRFSLESETPNYMIKMDGSK